MSATEAGPVRHPLRLRVSSEINRLLQDLLEEEDMDAASQVCIHCRVSAAYSYEAREQTCSHKWTRTS